MAAHDSNWEQQLQFVALTNIGMRRATNQDAHKVVVASDRGEWNQRGHFFIVADGMGAHAAGELASKIAVDVVPHLYRKYVELSPHEALDKAIVEANSEIHRRGQANNDFLHMGTTASAMVLVPQGILVGHVGDSRVYRLRDKYLHQLTADHSLAWDLRKQLSGNVELSNSVPKNIITRSLGPNAAVDVDIEGPLPVAVGDTFLLCSDGLTGKVTDEELAWIMTYLPPAEAAQLMIDLANLRGGPDNITVIVVRVVGEELATQDGFAEPLRLGAVRPAKELHPALWVLISGCFLAGMLLLVIGNLPAAGVATAAGVLCCLAVWLDRARRTSRGIVLGNGRQLGNGPYTEAKCPSPASVVSSLASITENYRSAPGAAHLDMDWGEYDALRYNAAEAGKRHAHADAVRFQAQAIRLLMQQILEAMNRDASDSAIGL